MMIGYYIKDGKSYTNWSEKDMEKKTWSAAKDENRNKLKQSIKEEVIRIHGEIPHSKSLDPDKVKKYTEMAYQLVMFLLKLWIKNG